MIQVKLVNKEHRNESRIFVQFQFNERIKNLVKQIETAKFSRTNMSFHIADDRCELNHLYVLLDDITDINVTDMISQNQYRKSGISAVQPMVKFKQEDLDFYSEKEIKPQGRLPVDYMKIELNKDKRDALLKFKYWMKEKRYADNTIDVYLASLRLFFSFYNDKPVYKITTKDVARFNNEYIIDRGLSVTMQNQTVSAIKSFYSRVQDVEIDVGELQRPRKPKTLPKVLSKREVADILGSLTNVKHKTMLSLIYACGLRRGELLNLKIEDIDSKRKLLIIRQAKGFKDRIAPLSDKVIEMLRGYFKMYRPKEWLFEGMEKGQQYSVTSLQCIFRYTLKKANINRWVSLHSLRHSFATHLLESGTDLRYIQEILGHKSSRTTEIYTHVSTQNIRNIKNPFDDLNL